MKLTLIFFFPFFLSIHVDPTHPSLPATVENIADAVTHARFVGTDQASDGVVLMKIVQVLRTLMLSPEGSALTNESVCEVMLSCFRICFEPRLNELLRRTAEQALKDIILLLFMRLPQFAEERHMSGFIKKLKMIANGGNEHTRRRKSSKTTKTNVITNAQTITPETITIVPTIKTEIDEIGQSNVPSQITTDDCQGTPNQLLLNKKDTVLATTPSTPTIGNIVDMQGKFMQTPQRPIENAENKQIELEIVKDKPIANLQRNESVENDADVEDDGDENNTKIDAITAVIKSNDVPPNSNESGKGEDFVNSMGVRFTPQSENGALTHNHYFLFSYFVVNTILCILFLSIINFNFTV